MIKAKKPESNIEYELCPAGNHLATVFKLVNIGHIETEYQGKKKSTHKIRIYWELPNEPKSYEKTVDGKQVKVDTVATVSAEYTLSLGDQSKLRPIIVGMLGKEFASEDEAYEFDIESLVGRSCLLNVVHEQTKDKTKTFAVVKSASPLLKGMEQPQMHNQKKIVDVNTSPEEEIDALYGTLKDKVKSSTEWKERQTRKTTDAGIDDIPSEINPEDIPFSRL